MAKKYAIFNTMVFNEACAWSRYLAEQGIVHRMTYKHTPCGNIYKLITEPITADTKDKLTAGLKTQRNGEKNHGTGKIK